MVSEKLVGDELVTDMAALTSLVEEWGDRVLCVLSTTSAFAPRAPDKIPEIAALCKAKNLPHVVNNAYGVQCSKYTHLVNEGSLLFFRPPLGLSLLL